MKTASQLHRRASELVDVGHSFHAAAQAAGSHAAAADSLSALEEALRVLSAAWYQVAADASPELADRRQGRGEGPGSRARGDRHSREREAHLVATLHDVAAAFASCARACREGRSLAAPIIAQRMATTKAVRESRERHASTSSSTPRSSAMTRQPPLRREATRR
jgi:hypothetical protein